MLTLYIADAERGVGMKNLSPKEAIAILSDMKIDIPVPKAAVTQRKRNTALDMAISALNCSEIPNNCPAADIVPVVRCKDCKYHWTHKCMDGMPIERCDLGQTFYDANIDYCSLAERREDATD